MSISIHRLKNVHQALGVSRTTLHRMIKSGQVKTVTLNRRCVGVTSEELARVIESAKQAA